MPQLAKPEEPTPPVAHHGFVIEAPTAPGEPFKATVPDFDDLYVFEIRRWQSRGGTLPAVGDEVLIVTDDRSEPWAPAWWPAGGDADLLASEGVGMIVHLEDSGKVRPPGFKHRIWYGTKNPQNAVLYDQWIKPS